MDNVIFFKHIIVIGTKIYTLSITELQRNK